MGVAGLWEKWHEPCTDRILRSFTMLTFNADDHPFMRNYRKPEDEKRMVVILPKELYADWLKVWASDNMEFKRQYRPD
ncbi:SOS response-associated peptidase [Pseudomonas mercuritolerans]|uniref:SOS response-associated peptidase n=1 Tax=Pseudomonas mercuritolerans TaxID=2951809 RepID=A0ABT2XZ07_9PSED|nr:SOS response-associated peptidase [Pseudomonas mercuritolerans]MCV2223917.1 SOS response-associated peptidase [Pseudomonas mercuritolerans]